MSQRKQPGYTILILLTVLIVVLAILTMIPFDSASKVSFMGYKALCSFTPISSLLLILLAGVVCKIRSKKFK